ncbi:hypothetical protein ACOACO_07690 [Nocardioides sp. CPCC 205120]|uniref:hypothetical protein n=1 Tax=Nocardioides sp. CPCC 205120 TaxID=3406462 RepID=UPI003B50557C
MLAAVAAVVLVVAAVAGTAALRGGGDDTAAPEPSDDASTETTSPTDAPSTGDTESTEEAADELPPLDGTLPDDLAPVCDREATLADGVPWSGEAADLRVLWLLEWPELPGYNRFDLLGAEGLPWNVQTAPGSWGGPNAVLCTRVVPGSAQVRQRCENTEARGVLLAWDVYTWDLQFELLEATTGEVIATGDPFSADETLPIVGCAFPPVNAVPGEVPATAGLLPDPLIPLADAFVRGA